MLALAVRFVLDTIKRANPQTPEGGFNSHMSCIKAPFKGFGGKEEMMISRIGGIKGIIAYDQYSNKTVDEHPETKCNCHTIYYHCE